MWTRLLNEAIRLGAVGLITAAPLPLTIEGVRLLVIANAPGVHVEILDAVVPYGASVIATHTGAEGLAAYDRHAPDLVILDLDLSDLDGLALCAAIRRRSDCPFLAMNGDTSVRAQVAVFEAGADDCITKPFDAALLRVRLAAILRRARPPSALDPDILQSGDGLVIDVSARTVRRTDAIVLLTPTEWDLLRTFLPIRRTASHASRSCGVTLGK